MSIPQEGSKPWWSDEACMIQWTIWWCCQEHKILVGPPKGVRMMVGFQTETCEDLSGRPGGWSLQHLFSSNSLGSSCHWSHLGEMPRIVCLLMCNGISKLKRTHTPVSSWTWFQAGRTKQCPWWTQKDPYEIHHPQKKTSMDSPLPKQIFYYGK